MTKQIKQLIREDETAKAIELAVEYCKANPEAKFGLEGVTAIKARYERWMSENLLGIANENSIIKIKLDLLTLIEGKETEGCNRCDGL